MSNVKVGIQTRSLRQPLKQAIQTAARLGASGVEIDARNELRPQELSSTGLREFHKRLEDLNLRVSAIAFPTRRGYDDAEDLDRRVQATQAALRFARDLRCDVVINRAGRIPTDKGDVQFTRLVEALTAIGSYGERVGARLAIQPGTESPAALADLLGLLPAHSVGVDLYPTALVVEGYSTLDAVETLGPHVLHVHACDAVRDSLGRTNEVELGRGMADLPAVLGQLTEFDYRGWVTIERRESPDPIREIENAVTYLNSL